MYFHPSPLLARHYRLRGFLRLEGLSQALAAEDVRAGWEVTLKIHINARSERPERYHQTLEEPRTTTPYADSIAYLTQEAKVLGAFKGEHVAQLVERIDDPQLGVVLVVQRRAGATIPERLRHGGRPPFEGIHPWIAEALRALAALHAAGAVHGGLGAASFIVDPRPDGRDRISLIDPGYARLVAEPTGLVGEPGGGSPNPSGPPPNPPGNPLAYRDVEQARIAFGKPVPSPTDPRVDVYAVARIAADLLGYDQLVTLDPLPLDAAGQPLQQRIADLAWRGREHIRNALGPPMEAWFLRALSLDPAQQFASASDALTAWRDVKMERRP